MSARLKALERLLSNGYQFVPVDDTGRPQVKWRDTNTAFDQLSKWDKKFPNANIALIGGRDGVCILDIDCSEEAIVKSLVNRVRRSHKDVLIRLCNKPRVALVFRAEPELLSRGNMNSALYISDDQVKHQLEFAARNKPMTIYGNHRKTGRKYTWLKNRGPIQTNISELSTISLDDLREWFNLFGALCDKLKYTLVRESTINRPDPGTAPAEITFDSVSAPDYKKFSDDEVIAMLKQVRGDTRDDWRDVGMALHSNYNGSMKGLRLWVEWSSHFDGYKGEQDCREQWASFREGRGITIGTLKFKAKEGEKKKRLALFDKFLARMVAIVKSSEVADLGKAPTESVISLKAFHEGHAHIVVPIKKRNKRTGETTEDELQITKLWMTHPQRKLCHARAYYPIDKRIIPGKLLSPDKHEQYYNDYQPPSVKYTSERSLIDKFLNQINYLFPDDGDAEWMLSWIADMVQNPTHRKAVAPLSISVFHGTGRGWLAQLLFKLVGESNTGTVNTLGEIMQDGAKNPYMYNTVLCVIAETYAGNKRFKVGNKMRAMISENVQNVDLKWGVQQDMKVFTRFFMQSNHLDALIVDEKDRRIQVFINRSLPKSEEYYDMLYKLLDTQEFVNQVYSYLWDYKIDDSLLKRASLTQAKQDLINATKSITAHAFYAFRDIVGDDLFMPDMIETFVIQHINHFSPGTAKKGGYNAGELKHLLLEQLGCDQLRHIGNKPYQLQSFAAVDAMRLPAKHVALSVKRARAKIKLFFDQSAQTESFD